MGHSEEYTALRDQWIREGEGFMLVYSITNRASFERIENFRRQINRVKDNEPTPIILVGNKTDRGAEREVGKEEGMGLARQYNWDFIETSAKTRQNLEQAYYTVVRRIRGTTETSPRPPRPQKKRKCMIF